MAITGNESLPRKTPAWKPSPPPPLPPPWRPSYRVLVPSAGRFSVASGARSGYASARCRRGGSSISSTAHADICREKAQGRALIESPKYSWENKILRTSSESKKELRPQQIRKRSRSSWGYLPWNVAFRSCQSRQVAPANSCELSYKLQSAGAALHVAPYSLNIGKTSLQSSGTPSLFPRMHFF